MNVKQAQLQSDAAFANCLAAPDTHARDKAYCLYWEAQRTLTLAYIARDSRAPFEL